MSITTDICCTKCKLCLWIGQGDFIYTAEEGTMKRLNDFLQAHKSTYDDRHELLFLNEHFNGSFENEGWEYVEGNYDPEKANDKGNKRCGICGENFGEYLCKCHNHARDRRNEV